MKFLPLFMITLLASNASLLCMDGDEDAAKKALEQQEDSFNRHKDYGRWDQPEYAERPTEPKEDSLASLLAELKEESQQPSDAEQATMWEETEPLITTIKEEDFGQPAVAPATSNLPASLENDDAEILATLRFRKEFQKLVDADQALTFVSLKRHKRTCKQFAQGGLGGVDANNVATIWQRLATGDCQGLADNSPARSLLMRHGVKIAQKAEGAEINSFLSPVVLSLFGEELAGNIRRIFARVHQINTEHGIDENPDTESAAILLSFPLIKKECTAMFDLQTRLLCALKGTKPDVGYAMVKQARKEGARQEAQARREALRAQLFPGGLGGHEHNANGECVDRQGNPEGCINQ